MCAGDSKRGVPFLTHQTEPVSRHVGRLPGKAARLPVHLANMNFHSDENVIVLGR